MTHKSSKVFRDKQLPWLLGSLQPVSNAIRRTMIEQEFPPPHALAMFHEAARSLGFRTGTCTTELSDWRKLPLPAVAFLRSASEVEQSVEGATPMAPEAVSNLDQQAAEHFAKTINKLKGKVTMLFITHQIPRGLQVDEVIELAANTPRWMEVLEEIQ